MRQTKALRVNCEERERHLHFCMKRYEFRSPGNFSSFEGRFRDDFWRAI